MTRTFLFLHAKRGRGERLLHALEGLEVLAVATAQPGFLGVEVAASAADGDSVVIVGSWASPAHYERWLAGPIPGKLLAQIEDLLAEPPDSRVYRIVESVS